MSFLLHFQHHPHYYVHFKKILSNDSLNVISGHWCNCWPSWVCLSSSSVLTTTSYFNELWQRRPSSRSRTLPLSRAQEWEEERPRQLSIPPVISWFIEDLPASSFDGDVFAFGAFFVWYWTKAKYFFDRSCQAWTHHRRRHPQKCLKTSGNHHIPQVQLIYQFPAVKRPTQERSFYSWCFHLSTSSCIICRTSGNHHWHVKQ